MSLEFIQHCEWNGKSIACSELHKPKLTNHGICYTFNAMPAKTLNSKYVTEYIDKERMINQQHFYYLLVYLNCSEKTQMF